jgi:hypothetical protein
MRFLRTRAFWTMVLEFLVVPLLLGVTCAGLLILALVMIVSVT